MRKADVFKNGELIGRITETDKNNYVFKYIESWVNDTSKPDLCLSMPKSAEEYRSSYLFPFFFNMLSEGANRKIQSKLLRIDENDHFGFLLATSGYDTLGSVTVHPVEENE